jgi:predicted Zn-dependent peptidase
LILTEKLACGARLLLEPVDTTDTLCIGFWFLHGSRDEGEGERGYAHFLEHMVFKGTRRRSALQIAQEIDRVGGLINAFTEKEVTCVYVLLPKEHIRLAFDVLSDMSFCSVLDADEMGKEKAVVANEILAIEDSPEEKGHERYLKGVWGSHPLARRITGETAEVEGIARNALKDNAVVAVAGNFDPKEARGLSEEAFRTAPPRSAHLRRTLPEARRFTSFVPDRFTQVQIYAGTSYAVNREIEHYYTSLVFSTAFGESMSSRLFQCLRENLGLCYSVYSFRTFFSDCGQLTVYANATPMLAGRLLEALDREFARAASQPVSAGEIADARSHLIGSMILSREDMESRMKRLVRQLLMIGRALEFEESVEMIKKVSREDTERFVSEYLRRDGFSLLVFGTRGISSLRGFEFSF